MKDLIDIVGRLIAVLELKGYLDKDEHDLILGKIDEEEFKKRRAEA